MFATLGLCAAPGPANAQVNACFLNNPFPVRPADPWQSQPNIGGNPYFGSSRGGGKRLHTGLDFHMPMNSNVPIQGGAAAAGGEAQHCNILGNEQSPLRNMGGYGRVMFFDCGNGIKVMYSHLNGYNASTKTAIVGDTGNARGTAPHVHYEVIIDGQQVDPMCVLGLAPPSSYEPRAMKAGPCPSSLPAGPANLCDPNIRNIIKQDGAAKGGKGGKNPGGTSYSPNAHSSGIYGSPSPEYDIPYPEGDGPEYEGEGSYDLEEILGTLLSGGGPMEPGDPGGVITPGTDHPPGAIPPLHDGDGKENEQTSCAVDTWVAMTNQSVMEARRETAMQRRFIAKADSVIEYGCMAKYLKKTETDVAAIFSETDQWVNRQVPIGDPYPPGTSRIHTMNKTLGAQSMDSALINVVWAAHEAYKQNFSHALMGGLEGYSEQPNGEACADMQKVWDAAKCQNFPGASEAFPRFTDLISNDPRKFPTATCNNTGIHQHMINAAKNKVVRYDAVDPKFEYVAPLDEKAGNCAPPVPTGVMVYDAVQPDPDSTDYKFGKMMKNLGERGYVTMDELEEAFPDEEEREIIIRRLQEAGVKILPAGTKVPDGEKIGDLLAGNNFIGDMKVYSDAVCPNPGCHYSNPDKEGLGECTFPAPKDEKDK